MRGLSGQRLVTRPAGRVMLVVASTVDAAPDGPARRGAPAGDTLLTSKVTVPSVPAWLVPRPRIDKLIAQGAQGPITTVTGPPGAGKTMALAMWAAASPAGGIAWVTIDDYDNRPRVFWSYVLAALRRAGVPVPRALSATVRRSAADHEFLLRFASVVAEQDPPVTLVLDDVHLLTAPKVLEGLAYVLRYAGPGLHLVASSRLDPLLPLHRYRLTGELTEIRASDLAFSVAESRQLLAQHGVRLSEPALEQLTKRAEGWAAVMRLAAISMDGHSDPEQFVKELVAEDSAVTGYLVEEVLNAQPGHVRDFLLKTSILDRVSEEIATELAGGGYDTAILPELARANALVQRDDGGWYRYHSLFAAVLRLKLRREHPGQVPGLHLRAARWYRRNGLLAEAVRHAAEADDWQFAARAVVDELVIGQLLEPRGNEPLADGFGRMPLSRDWPEPQPLLVAAAIEFSRGADGASAGHLGAAEAMLGARPTGEETPSRLAVALIRLALARRAGDLKAAAAAAGAARVLIEAIGDDHLARHPEVRAQVLAGRGAVELWSGHLDEAAAIFDAGAAAAQSPESENERADCLGHLALIEALRGRLNRAAEFAAEAAGRPDDDTDWPAGPISRAAEVALAWVYLDRNELQRARIWQKRAHDALRARPDKLIGAAAYLVAARRSLPEGRGKAASEMIGRARAGWSPPLWLDRELMLLDSWACAMAGDFHSAIDAATRAGAESSLDAAVALAHALLAAGDLEAAKNALASAPPGDEAPDNVRLAARLAEAQLRYATGDRSRGRRLLEQALLMGESEQLRLPFAIGRSWIRPVLRRDPELAHAYRRLLEPDLVSPAWIDARHPRGGQADDGQAAPLIVEPLSEREREVLEHVSAMESTAEIATEMYISVNTVKTHLKSIYRKLAATHRGEAVRRARQFGLL
jgi:LuxR family transcriptional regulator, maltose regulon positive regulatory protein